MGNREGGREMSDTPETDKEWGNWLHKLKIPIESFVDFARKLERERNEWRECAEEFAAWMRRRELDESAMDALIKFGLLKGASK